MMLDRLLKSRPAANAENASGSLLDAVAERESDQADRPVRNEIPANPTTPIREQDNRPGSLLNQLGDLSKSIEDDRERTISERRQQHFSDQANRNYLQSQIKNRQNRSSGQRAASKKQADALAERLENIRRSKGAIPDAQSPIDEARTENQYPLGQRTGGQPAAPRSSEAHWAAPNIPHNPTDRPQAHPTNNQPTVEEYPQTTEPPRRRQVPLLDLDQMFLTMFRGWKTILVCGLLGGVLAYAVSKTLPNEYTATAQLLVDPRGAKILDVEVIPGNLNNAATISYLESQMRIIRSSSVLSRVIEVEKLNSDPEFSEKKRSGLIGLILGEGNAKHLSAQLVMENLQEKLVVSRGERTYVIAIEATTQNPESAAKIANSVAQEYIENEIGAQANVAESASKNLTERLDSLREKVRIDEQRVEDYKAENLIIGVGGTLTNEVQLSKINEQLAFAKVQTGEAKTRYEQARRTDLTDVIAGALPAAARSSELSQLRVIYAQLKAQSGKLATKLGPRHPERIATTAELASAKAQMKAEIRRTIAKAGKDFERARAREQELAQQVNVLKSMSVETNSALIKLRELQRDADASRKVYEGFLLRSRETSAQTNITFTNARLIQVATPPLKKSGPKRKIFAIGGAVLGGGLGGLLVLMLNLTAWQRLSNAAVPSSAPSGNGGLIRRKKPYLQHPVQAGANGYGEAAPTNAVQQSPPRYQPVEARSYPEDEQSSDWAQMPETSNYDRSSPPEPAPAPAPVAELSRRFNPSSKPQVQAAAPVYAQPVMQPAPVAQPPIMPTPYMMPNYPAMMPPPMMQPMAAPMMQPMPMQPMYYPQQMPMAYAAPMMQPAAAPAPAAAQPEMPADVANAGTKEQVKEQS